MIIPNPKDGESEEQYIWRCFNNPDVIQAYPDKTFRYECICIKWFMIDEVKDEERRD